MHLPIAERELRVAARSSRIYRGRMVACLIFGAITLWMLWVMRKAFAKNAVEMAFGFISNIALMLCMFSCSATADAISSEKRGGTLGFLFLTDLKGVDVIFGKLAATALMSFYGLLAIIPVLSMPVLMGGIPGESVFRTAVTLINAMFFSLSCGLWISARSWEQKKANSAAVWVAITFLWVFPALAAGVEQKFQWTTLAASLRVFSPLYQLQKAGPFGIGMLHDQFWASIAILHALGWIALWRACRIVPHQWQDRPEPLRARIIERWNHWKLGPLEVRERFRRQLIELNPVHWLSARDRFGPASIWFLLVFMWTLWTGTWIWIEVVSRGQGPPYWGVGIPVVFLTQVILRLKTAVVASDVLTRDRFSGALELLLSTSLSLTELSRGIWMTVRRFILWPAVVTLIAGTIIFIFAITTAQEQAPDEVVRAAWIVYICLGVLFILDLVAAVWTGLWMSCVARLPNAPGGMSMLRLLVIPWVAFFATMSLLSYFQVRSFFEHFEYVFLTWFSFCLVNNIYWIFHSREKFFENIRVAASERFIPSAGDASWWKFWRKPDRAGG